MSAVGGNHEAMNYLWELYYGGWVAPNTMYLGHAGVVKFGGIRIGGLTGIFNGSHYKQVCHEFAVLSNECHLKQRQHLQAPAATEHRRAIYNAGSC